MSDVFRVVLKNLGSGKEVDTLQFFSTQEDARDWVSKLAQEGSAKIPIKQISGDEVHVLKGLNALLPEEAYSYIVQKPSIAEALNLLLASK